MLRLRSMLHAALATALSAAALSLAANAAQACDIAGTWSGPVAFRAQMADRGTRTLTLTVKSDCTYQFTVPGVVDSPGSASAGWSAGSYSYANAAGSRGTFTVSGRTMEIVQSQGNYTAKLTKRGR